MLSFPLCGVGITTAPFRALSGGEEKIHGKAIEEDLFFALITKLLLQENAQHPFPPLSHMLDYVFAFPSLLLLLPPILMGGGGGGLYWGGGGDGEKGQGFGFQKRQYSILLQHTNRSVFPTFFSGRRLGEKDRKKVPQREKKNI